MAVLSGHHWTTHGLADIVGFVLVIRGISMDGAKFAVLARGSWEAAAWRCGSW
jgi:hypothetical protein